MFGKLKFTKHFKINYITWKLYTLVILGENPEVQETRCRTLVQAWVQVQDAGSFCFNTSQPQGEPGRGDTPLPLSWSPFAKSNQEFNYVSLTFCIIHSLSTQKSPFIAAAMPSQLSPALSSCTHQPLSAALFLTLPHFQPPCKYSFLQPLPGLFTVPD